MKRAALALLFASAADGLRRQKIDNRAHMEVAVNASLLQSIESRVQQAKTQLKHRERVRQHMLQQVDAGLADRLTTHMHSGRLAMWDPEDSDAVKDAYIVMYHDLCAKDDGVDNHVLAVEKELKTSGTPVHHYNAALHGFFGKFTLSQVEELLKDNCFKSIEQDYTVRLDPKVETQPAQPSTEDNWQDNAIWGLDQIDGTVDGRYRYVNDGTGVYIYIVDTGIPVFVLN